MGEPVAPERDGPVHGLAADRRLGIVLAEVQQAGVAGHRRGELRCPLGEVLELGADRQRGLQLDEEVLEALGGVVGEVQVRRVGPAAPALGEGHRLGLVGGGCGRGAGAEAPPLVPLAHEVGGRRDHEPCGEAPPDHLGVGEQAGEHRGLHGDRHGEQRVRQDGGLGPGLVAALAVPAQLVARPRLEVDVQVRALGGRASQEGVEQVGLGGEHGQALAVGGQQRGDGLGRRVVDDEPGHGRELALGHLHGLVGGEQVVDAGRVVAPEGGRLLLGEVEGDLAALVPVDHLGDALALPAAQPVHHGLLGGALAGARAHGADEVERHRLAPVLVHDDHGAPGGRRGE